MLLYLSYETIMIWTFYGKCQEPSWELYLTLPVTPCRTRRMTSWWGWSQLPSCLETTPSTGWVALQHPWWRDWLWLDTCVTRRGHSLPAWELWLVIWPIRWVVTGQLVMLLLMFSSWQPCHQGWDSPWLPSYVSSSFLSSLFSHCVLYHQSPTPIFCRCSPFSSHYFQISLNAVLPSHSWSSSPPFPSSLWASDLFASFPSSILSKQMAHFNLHLINFFVELSSSKTSTFI